MFVNAVSAAADAGGIVSCTGYTDFTKVSLNHHCIYIYRYVFE